MAGGVQFHHTISTLLSQRDLKKMEKGRKKEICPPHPTHSKHTREGRRFPVWGSPPRRHRVASRQVKDNALDLDCGAHGRIGRRITTLGYSVRGFTPQGLLHTQHSMLVLKMQKYNLYTRRFFTTRKERKIFFIDQKEEGN